MRVRWLPAAARARRGQLDYIGARDLRAALDAGDRIKGAVRLIEQHPSLGRPGTHELVIVKTPFLIVYRVENDAITILRLFHGAQDWPNMP